MTTKSDLRGSFGSLIDTLSQRFDPLQTQPVVEAWLGLLGQAASIARERSKWRDLPDERDDYVEAEKSLDDGTKKLVMADGEPAAVVLAALAECERTLEMLEQLLDR